MVGKSLRRKITDVRYQLEIHYTRQRSNLWTLVQLAGFAAIFFGVFRLFGIGVYGMDGIGPISRDVFMSVYLPGPWTSSSVTWELAFIWISVGVLVVLVSTGRRF